MIDKKLIIANWKNHPDTASEASSILEAVDGHIESLGGTINFSLVFCPPFVFVEDVSKILKTSNLGHSASLGAQDIAVEDSGALTGEISGSMLQKLDVRYVIIGHSERRWKLGESDELVNKKIMTALKDELIPIVCVGERSREGDYKKILEDQALKTFAGLSADDLGRCVIAYEPVWAISTNPDARPDTPESALESIKIIKNILIGNWKLATRKYSERSSRRMTEIGDLPKVLYGGSITSKNAELFLKEKDINGVLVGGASINKEEFIRILKIASKM